MTDRVSATGQMGFGGFEAPQPTDRLFFAIFPDAAAAARIADVAQALRDQHQLHSKPLRTDRFHVTLHHLGDYAGLPDDVVTRARAAAARVAMPGFEVVFDSASSFGGRSHNRPLVLRGDAGMATLLELQRRLGERMTAAGLGRLLGHRFTPHVTLLYDDRMVAPQATGPIAWTVREFALVHSLLGRTEHRILGRWPLLSE